MDKWVVVRAVVLSALILGPRARWVGSVLLAPPGRAPAFHPSRREKVALSVAAVVVFGGTLLSFVLPRL